MATQKITSSQYFKMLNILYFALISTPFLFLIFIYIFSQSGGFIQNITFTMQQALLLAIPVGIAIPLAGSSLHSKRLAAIKINDVLSKKLTLYQVAFIIKMSLIEVAAFMCILFYFMSSNAYLLVGFVISMFFGIMAKPSKEKLFAELKLSKKEMNILNSADFVVIEREQTN